MAYEYFGDMKPYVHQEVTVKFMLANKRAYIWNDMGTGKTASSLWFLDMVLGKPGVERALVIAPLSTIRSVWADEIKKICPYREYSIVHGDRQTRLAAFESKAHIYITNTDCVRNYEKEIARLNPSILIIDEVTSFANPSSKRSKAMQRIAKACKAVYGLSGNPTSGGLMNAFGIAKVVNPSNLPTPYKTRFQNMIMTQLNMYEYIPKPEATAIVNHTLRPAISYSLEECVDLPPIIYETRYVELPKPTMGLFKEMLKHQLAEFKGGLITAQTAGVKSIRLMQILTGFTKTEEGEIIPTDISPKLSELASIYMEAGCKLVVFAQSVNTVKIIKKFFDNRKIPCDMIYGDVPVKTRERHITHFQNSTEGVIVAQVKTMSHGITLTASHTLVFFGPVAGNETYRQAIRRIRRIGQDHKQTIIRLISTKFEDKVFQKLDQEEFTSLEMLNMYKDGEDSFL